MDRGGRKMFESILGAEPQGPTVRSAHPAPLKFRGLAQRLVLRFVKRYECASKGL
jgi:hypothetical protein